MAVKAGLYTGTGSLGDKLFSLLHPQPHLSPVTIWMFGRGGQTHRPAFSWLFFIQAGHRAGDAAKLSITVSAVYPPELEFWVRERDFIYGCKAIRINFPNSHVCQTPSVIYLLKMFLIFASFPLGRLSGDWGATVNKCPPNFPQPHSSP